MPNISELTYNEFRARAVTMDLVEHLLCNQPLTPQETVCFAVDTLLHYRALQTVVNVLCREELAFMRGVNHYVPVGLCRAIVALDAAFDNSQKLNALVETYAALFSYGVRFHTLSDQLLSRSEAMRHEPGATG